MPPTDAEPALRVDPLPPNQPGERAAPIVLAAAAAAAVWVPGFWAPVAAVASSAVWWRRSGGSYRMVAAPLLAALIVALALGEARRFWWSSPERVEAEVARQIGEVWTELERTVTVAAGRFASGMAVDEASAEFFLRLDAVTDAAEDPLGLLLFDPDGQAVAWAGEGLLHEPAPELLPRSGRAHRSGFESATLVVVRAIGSGVRPWRLVAGRSLGTGDLPRPLPGRPVRWSVLEPGEAPMVGALPIEGSSPRLVWRPGPPPIPVARSIERRGAAALGAVVALLAVVAGPGRGRRRWARVAAVTVATGLVAVALAVDPTTMAMAVGLVALAGSVWAASRPVFSVGVVGTAAAAVALAMPLAAERLAGGIDLGSAIAVPGAAWLLRAAVPLPILALLALVRRRRRAGDARAGRLAWLAWGLLAAAAALLDLVPPLALALLLGGALLAAAWRASTSVRRPVASGLLILMAVSIAAVGWEVVARELLERDLSTRVLPALGAPDELAEMTLRRRLAERLEATDLAELTLRDPSRLDTRDLAFALWRRSPLAVHGALSALTVATRDGELSAFGFGLPLTEEGEIDRSPLGGVGAAFESISSSLVQGETELDLDGRPWGVIRFWMHPRPGFQLSDHPLESLAAGLLRGRLGALLPVEELLGPARFTLYGAGGEILASTWSETPPSPPGKSPFVDTPDGTVLWMAAEGPRGRRVLFLPVLGPGAGLERAGTHAFGALACLALVLALGRLPRLGRALPAIREAMASYSLRLPIVYALLVMVPLLVLNVVLVRIAGQRFERDQRLAARLALDSAQRVLGEYVLTLEPGFGIDTALDDELLVWLSRVVHSDLNLYWGSGVYASSKRELFTAGLLPNRIPGEIFSRLALRGAEIASRTNRAGGVRYLEVYTAIRVPGVALERLRLFASLPRLAQQEEADEALASLRRRAILVTSALALILAAVSSRLARSFTQPLMAIVRGTQRIADGARSIEIAPAERELATLVEAIDSMAAKIAEGRQRLLLEKELVDRMIDNVTSAVVSLDGDRRVLMANRAAQRMLEVAIGESLDDALTRDERLAPLAEAAALARERRVPATARLGTGGDGEREWTVVWVPLSGDGDPAALMVVEDVTEVLRVERLEAWAEMARMIAHEIKNPLTPIRLSTEHLREVKGKAGQNFDQVFERCTTNILEQVEELQRISTEFSSYSRIPRIEPRPGDFAAAVERVVEGYRMAPPRGVEIVLQRPEGPLDVTFDEKLLGRAVRNLIENAVRAVGSKGTVRVVVEAQGDLATVRVADTGPGVDPNLVGRIFDPYFSTHDTGTGLGLPIARRIAEEHGGEIRARNRAEGGLEVWLTVPRVAGTA